MNANTPVTLDMLELAIEQCAEAFGETLRKTLVITGTPASELKSISLVLNAAAQSSSAAHVQPLDLARTAILKGFLKPLKH